MGIIDWDGFEMARKKDYEELERRKKESIDWCKAQVIKWRLIDTITPGFDLLSDEGIRELHHALDLAATCEYWGLNKKASYIRRRIRDKMNYIESR